jgi:SAM-dependent methyltransferase
MAGAGRGFLRAQHEEFDRADAAHFEWPVFSQTERALLTGVVPASQRFLEVGCGEGANLVHLAGLGWREPALRVGVDLFYKKVRFAADRVRGVTFLCADAHALPFRARAFDAILCRDILHHVEDPQRVVEEVARLCAPGGSVVVLEPNRLNPLMGALGVVRPFERGILRSSARALRAILERHFTILRLEYRQALPISRVLLHYQFGCAGLGQLRWVGTILQRLEACCARVMPRRGWAYICMVASPKSK